MKIIQRTHASTLGEQLVELETDELAPHSAESRQRLSSDRYRPHCYYVPPEDLRQNWGHALNRDELSTTTIGDETILYTRFPEPSILKALS